MSTLTWAHVVHAASPELVTVLVGRAWTYDQHRDDIQEIECKLTQAKVGDGDTEALIKAEHVLGLEVAMIDTERMTELDSVKKL